MKIIIEIETDNAAFEDEGEITRIAKRAVATASARSWTATELRLRDINGNTVGKVTVEP